jgi:ligand-binding sensor domain-containing protein
MTTVKRIARVALLTGMAVLTAAAAVSAPGDWNVYMDASSFTRVTAIGDSLWCGTRGGILLFDMTDSTFTSFLDGLELKSNDITAVTLDGRGSIWAAMRTAGVARIDDPGGAFSVRQYSEALSGIVGDSVTCLLRVEDDIYYGCRGGAAKFYENIPAAEPVLTDSLDGKSVNDMAWDGAAGLLWVACGDGIASFDRATFDFEFYPLGEVLSVCVFEGEVYCAAGAEIRHLGDGSWPALGSSLDPGPVAVAAGGGSLFCVNTAFVYRWNGTFWQGQESVALKNLQLEEFRISWSQNILGALAVDAAGTPWVGGFSEASSRGVYLAGLVPSGWMSFRMEGLSQNLVNEISCDVSGNIWASTGKYGISYRSTGGDWISYTKIRSDVENDDALSFHENNLALLYDSQGYLWCNSLTYDLDLIDVGDALDKDDDIWAHISPGSGTITSNRFVEAVEGPGGNRWFLSDDGGFESGMWGINIANRAGDDWMIVDPGSEPRMQGGNVFDCAFDDIGVYVALRGYGVQYWRTNGFDWPSLTSPLDDTWVTILSESQLPSTDLWAIERGGDGSIWVGTSAGLVRYYQGAIDSFTVKTSSGEEGLIGGAVYDIEFDGGGNLWVATSKGINRIDREGNVTGAWTSALKWQDELQIIYPEDVISPLPDHVCRALAYDVAGGLLWIGTDNGLASFDVNEPVEVTLPMSEMILYPNPVHVTRGDDALRISRISGPVSVRVYTVEGGLVHEAEGVLEDEVAWDLLTLNGYIASSGIYIVRVEGEGGTSMRKVAVIR